VLRVLYIGHFDNPASRLHLLQITQEIVQVRDWKLLEGDVERGLAPGLRLALRWTGLFTGLAPLRGLSFHSLKDELPSLRLE